MIFFDIERPKEPSRRIFSRLGIIFKILISIKSVKMKLRTICSKSDIKAYGLSIKSPPTLELIKLQKVTRIPKK